MSTAAAHHPRSSMLYHLVIIGDGFPDEPPPDISLLFRLPAAKPRKARAKRGPGGAAVEMQKSSGRLWSPRRNRVEYEVARSETRGSAAEPLRLLRPRVPLLTMR